MTDKLDIIHDAVLRVEKKVDNHAERITKIEASYFNGGNGIKSKAENNEKELEAIKIKNADCFGGNFWKSVMSQLNQVSTLVILALVGIGFVAYKVYDKI